MRQIAITTTTVVTLKVSELSLSVPFFDRMEIVDQHGKRTGKTEQVKLSDRLDALTLFGKATGFLNEKVQNPSRLEEFGAEVLLAMRKEIEARIAARKSLNGHAE